MKISTLKNHLNTVSTVDFVLENGTKVPAHFHVTEVGIVTKNFIDCGGTVREERVASLQLWNANDYDHRLQPSKLNTIIALSEKVLGMEDLEIEVEYQGDTIGKYGLDFQGDTFVLTTKKTACLAQDQCGVETPKPKVRLSDLPLSNANTCCTPDGGCC